jgi:hypothetical protein
MNTKYGKLVDGQVVYAPNTLDTEDGKKMNPSEASYLAAGWKKVVDEPPAPEDGCTVEVSGWTEGEDALTKVYKQVAMPAPQGGGQGGDTPPAPAPVGKRIFSKLKLVAALKAADKWVLVKTWLEEKAYYDFYLAAQNFSEDYPLFQQGLAALKSYARLTDEEVEAILAKCVAD